MDLMTSEKLEEFLYRRTVGYSFDWRMVAVRYPSVPRASIWAFILDVLQDYTPYSLAFKLANAGKELDDKEVERSAAVKTLMR